MRQAISLILAANLAVAVASAGPFIQEQASTPAEQYKRLFSEFARASSGGGNIMTDAERMQFVGRAYRNREELAVKLLALARKYPNDPIALDALTQAVWQVNGTPWPVQMVGEPRARPGAFEIIERDHIRSDKLGPLCQRVSYGFAREYESFLRAVLAKNPHRSVQAIACLSLGHFLYGRLQRMDLCKDQPQLAKEFAGLFGADYLAKLQRQDRAKAVRESEAILERAAKSYGDIAHPDGGTIAQSAETELFGIRYLSVGKTAADIEGVDQDGKRFKLSDYRGKVVLLDFWSFV